ncbi:MAG: ROK family protein [Myxococcales bacterium]|nr:ROK family protein [Myxococcales bacterium]
MTHASDFRLGVDLGGTKTEIIALTSEGQTLLRRRVATPRDCYGDIVATITRLVHEAEVTLGGRGTVGVAMPGALSVTTGLVKNANTTSLIGRPFDDDLSASLERPVRVDNDANCFTISEAVDGSAQGRRVVFGVIVGTGTGGGLVVDGRPIVGPNRIAGEWGHNPLPWPKADELPGPGCYCGKSGCIETFLSGPGLVRCHEARGGEHTTAEAIVQAAQADDPTAIETLRRYYDRLARSLATVINLLDPDIIVVGGGMSNLPKLFELLPKLWQSLIFSDTTSTIIAPPKHGDSSGVRGAAWLWPVR